MIALLTDFEHGDGLGVMKGLIKSISPAAEIIDLYNHIGHYNVRSGAWILLKDCAFFPKGTVFCCVVDPGVGSSRKAVAIKTANYFFVGPDNGLMYPAASSDKIECIVQLDTSSGSKTFHGRDVFAPAAARLDNGVSIGELGVGMSQLQKLEIAAVDGNGEIVLIDHYGNVITNIPQAESKGSYEVSCSNFKNNLKFRSTYAEAVDVELFVIEGSKNTLELSVKQGSAAESLGCSVGNKITIR